MGTDTIKQQGFQPGKSEDFPLILTLLCAAVEFLHSQFGKYLSPVKDGGGDLTEVVTGGLIRSLSGLLFVGQISKYSM